MCVYVHEPQCSRVGQRTTSRSLFSFHPIEAAGSYFLCTTYSRLAHNLLCDLLLHLPSVRRNAAVITGIAVGIRLGSKC